MKKNLLKSEKGITLVILLLTIIVMSIIASFAISNVYIGTDIKEYNYMCADIELLESKIMVYYNNNEELPVMGAPFDLKPVLGDQASTRDNEEYYQIDLSKLENITLTFGGGTIGNKNIYVINGQSHKVYYLKGTVLEDSMYYAKK